MHFSLLLTEHCNWKCDYCVSPTIANPKNTNIDILKKHLPYISRAMNKLKRLRVSAGVDIQGGEIGLLDIDTLRYLFQEINHPIIVSTNGVFLEKNYHHDPVIRKCIGAIYYHLHPDPSFFSKSYKTYFDDEIFISSGIVGNNADTLVSFVQTNSKATFHYIALENKIDSAKTISREDNIYLYDKLKVLPNVTEECLNLISKNIQTLKILKKNPQETCRNNHNFIHIDLVNEKIFLCIRSYDVAHIPLNEKNLKKVIRTSPNKIFTNYDRCGACIRLSVERSNRSLHKVIDKFKIMFFK